MKRNRATDWDAGRLTPLEDIEPENTQLHHIFPFDLMIKDRNAWKRYEDEGYSLAEYRADVNDIANITFLSSSTNESLSDTSPSQYLLASTTPETRKAHFIPRDRDLWKTENFIDFLGERRKLIAKAITSFLKRI